MKRERVQSRFLILIRVAIITLHIIIPTSCNIKNSSSTIVPTAPQTAAVQLAAAQGPIVIEPANIQHLKAAPTASLGRVTGFVWLPDSQEIILAGSQGISRYAAAQQAILPQTGGVQPGETITTTQPLMITSAQGQDTLAWVDQEQSVVYWDMAAAAPPETIASQENAITGLAISPPGEQLAYATAANDLRVWDTRSQQTSLEIQTPAWLTNLSYSPDGSQIGGVDLANFTVYILDARSGEILRTLAWTDSPSTLYGVYFSPDWASLAWVAQSAVQLMDAGSGKPGHLLNHPDFVNALAWSPDGGLVATASAAEAQGGLRPAVLIWEAASGRLLQTLPQANPVQSLSFSPDGGKLAVLDSMGQFQVWQIQP
jgi:WD40 repeat protein